MNTKQLILCLGAATMAFTSCIKDEPLNAEADIEQVTVHLDNPLETFFQLSDTTQNVLYADSTITFSVRSQADLTALAPTFKITDGATISPAGGMPRDFSQGPLTYTVTSQDGHWTRLYTLQFKPKYIAADGDTIDYDFEDYILEPKNQAYYVWREEQADGTYSTPWASGNPGFWLSKGSAKPDEYPTYVVADGRHGAAVGCTTRSTGELGALLDPPRLIAAGNMFLGTFDVGQALTNTLHATNFGIPFNKKPVSFKGFYKYRRGAVFQDLYGNVMDGKKDYGTIYAVLYKNHDADGNSVTLYGDDVKSSPQIVALADVGKIDDTPGDGWQEFDVDFTYSEPLDAATLDDFGYNLAIVCSSSENGAYFEGAVGSTLTIDDFQLICTLEQ